MIGMHMRDCYICSGTRDIVTQEQWRHIKGEAVPSGRHSGDKHRTPAVVNMYSRRWFTLGVECERWWRKEPECSSCFRYARRWVICPVRHPRCFTSTVCERRYSKIVLVAWVSTPDHTNHLRHHGDSYRHPGTQTIVLYASFHLQRPLKLMETTLLAIRPKDHMK